ncbi:MAG: AAA family ATPase [Deltaproteobacteria bacterium]|nr:AAA family ATPase [Deltaproteobacteria bacterium]
MFESFYGLEKNPFKKTPDPSFLYYSKGHKEAYARLHYAVEEREIILLTGEVGCGKTTLSRALMDALDETYIPIVMVGPLFGPGELLTHLAHRLNVTEPSLLRIELMEQIGSKFFELYQEGLCPVIIIDEAQLIPGREGLDELRLLTNLQLDDENLFSLVLLGQPELRERLLSGYNEAFRQRIGVQYHLGVLNYEEVREYLRFRLTKAGREEPLFTEPAMEELHRFSNGVPRKINNLASSALLEGFGRGAVFIDRDIILSVAKDYGLIRLHA